MEYREYSDKIHGGLIHAAEAYCEIVSRSAKSRWQQTLDHDDARGFRLARVAVDPTGF